MPMPIVRGSTIETYAGITRRLAELADAGPSIILHGDSVARPATSSGASTAVLRSTEDALHGPLMQTVSEALPNDQARALADLGTSLHFQERIESMVTPEVLERLRGMKDIALTADRGALPAAGRSPRSFVFHGSPGVGKTDMLRGAGVLGDGVVTIDMGRPGAEHLVEAAMMRRSSGVTHDVTAPLTQTVGEAIGPEAAGELRGLARELRSAELNGAAPVIDNAVLERMRPFTTSYRERMPESIGALGSAETTVRRTESAQVLLADALERMRQVGAGSVDDAATAAVYRNPVTFTP